LGKFCIQFVYFVKIKFGNHTRLNHIVSNLITFIYKWMDSLSELETLHKSSMLNQGSNFSNTIFVVFFYKEFQNLQIK
jgi:hypothetical protein